MESPENKELSCPPFEALSEYFDKECKDGSPIASHVASCTHCRRVLDELAILTASLSGALEKSAPPDISEKILAGLKVRMKSSEKKFNFYSPFLIYARAAALVAILGVVGYFVWDDYSVRQNLTPPVSVTQVRHSAEVDAGLSPAEPELRPFHKLGAIDVADLDSVSFSNQPVYELNSVEKNGSENGRAVIPSRVKQVWTVSSQDTDFRQTLMSLLFSIGINKDHIKYCQEKDKFTISFESTKLQSVKFVRGCKALGFSLLSPEQPQPEQNRFSGEAAGRVRYSADFVAR